MNEVSIINIEENVFVLGEADQNVFLLDAVRFDISKKDRIALFDNLTLVARSLFYGEDLDIYERAGILKKLTGQLKAKKYNLWEIRDEATHGRLIFVREDPDAIIVAAVNKGRGRLDQAINRGANRWAKYQRKKSACQ